MRLVRLASLTAAALTTVSLTVVPALAFDISVRVHAKGCAPKAPCEDYISDDALNSPAAKERRERIDKIQREEALEEKKDLWEWFRQILVSDEKLYESATLRNHHCSDLDEPGEPESYLWLRPEELRDGEAALAELQERARRPGNGFQIVELTGLSKKDEQHIGRCEVRIINGVVGPPTNCAIVAIATPTSTLLRARRIAFGRYGCPSAASFRLGGGIQLDFNIATQLNVSTFSKPLIDMLRNNLGLSVEATEHKAEDRIYSISLASTAGLRDSVILGSGWREALDFDLYLTDESTISKKSIVVRGIVNPMVSRQAAGSLVEYHAPNDAQRTVYAKAFDSRIADALKGACRRGNQIDDKTIVCEGER